MKKFFVIALASVLSFFLLSCSGESSDSSEPAITPSVTVTLDGVDYIFEAGDTTTISGPDGVARCSATATTGFLLSASVLSATWDQIGVSVDGIIIRSYSFSKTEGTCGTGLLVRINGVTYTETSYGNDLQSLTITSWAEVGEFVSGTFSGSLTADGGTSFKNVSGSFTVRRYADFVL